MPGKNARTAVTLVFAIVLGAGTVGSSKIQAAEVSANTASAAEVQIDNFTFQTPMTTVPAGTAVTWVNHDDIPHTVVSENQLFKSKALDTGDKFSYTFSQPGTYKYFCSIHPKMTAEIVVK